jgi:2'-5' RNA ligase
MRLFTAFLLDEKVRAELSRVAAGLAKLCGGVRWVPSAQVHITVKFLGEVLNVELNAIVVVL